MACLTSELVHVLLKRPVVLKVASNKIFSGVCRTPALRNSPSVARFFASTARLSSKVSQDLTGRKYSDKHEWITVKDGIGTVGISHHAQDSLGEIVFVQLPQVGDSFAVNDEIGSLESVKAASEIYAPVSGEVVEKNESVEQTPSLVNKSCYEKGWLYRVKLDSPAELKKLMDEDAYTDYLKSQEHDAL